MAILFDIFMGEQSNRTSHFIAYKTSTPTLEIHMYRSYHIYLEVNIHSHNYKPIYNGIKLINSYHKILFIKIGSTFLIHSEISSNLGGAASLPGTFQFESVTCCCGNRHAALFIQEFPLKLTKLSFLQAVKQVCSFVMKILI